MEPWGLLKLGENDVPIMDAVRHKCKETLRENCLQENVDRIISLVHL